MKIFNENEDIRSSTKKVNLMSFLIIHYEYPKGKLGGEYTTDEGYQYARLTGNEVFAVQDL